MLAERVQSKEREELTDEEKGKLFMELMEKSRKHFAALKAQEKRTQMSTYLKHMGGYTYKQLKGKSFDEIQKLFDKEMKRLKAAERRCLEGKEQHQESSKKQRMEEDKESNEVDEVSEDDEGELMKHLVIKKDEDIAIDAIPLATKLPVIIDYKLHKEGMLVHYQLIRADGSSKRYSSMIRMLQGIDREDLEALWKIVKIKYSDIRPEDEFERVLWGDLKVMFEPDIRSDVWRILQGYRVTVWKLIDSSRVHFVRRNLKIQKMNIKFRGGLLGLKRLHGFLEVTTAQCLLVKGLQCLKISTVKEDKDEIRIKMAWRYKIACKDIQFFQIQDYALWEVIENGNSWVSVPQTTQENGILVTKMYIPVTAEEKTNKKNDVKARGLLLMGTSIMNIQLHSVMIVCRLAILGVVHCPRRLKLKILSSLPPEWNTHVVVWMKMSELRLCINDLYNNFKIVEQKLKKIVGTSSGGQNMAFMTALSTSSTNDANIGSPQVSAASPSINAASPQVCTASVSDNNVYAFMIENPNGFNVLHQDLEQIHEDDLEAMDLKWQLSLLSVRAKKYYQRTGKKIFINANGTAGYDKSKVECYICHKLGHFARECRAPRSKEGQFRNQDNTRKQGNNEDTSSKAMLAIDGCDDLLVKLNESEFKAATYKRGLATLEDKIITYKKNEQEKDGIDFKIEKFDKALKDLDQLLGSQITEKSLKGLGYSAVPPHHPLIYNRPNKLDLSYSGLDEFKEPEFKGYGFENSKQESNVVCDKESDNSKENYDESMVEEQVSQDKNSFVESSPNVDKETVFPINKKVEFTKPKNHEKPVKKSVRNMSPKAVLLKTGLTPLNTVRPVNTAHPKTTVNSAKSKTHFSKQAQSTAKRHFYKQTTLTRRSVHAEKKHFYTGRHNAVNTARSYTRQVMLLGAAQMMIYGFIEVDAQGTMLGTLAISQILRNLMEVMLHLEEDETSEILKNFIKEIENLVDKKVKIIRSDNGTEFKNKVLDDFCREKCIKREYSVARTPQKNGVAERRTMTLIEAARTMLANSKLPITFWAEAVSTACYVQNRVLVVKPHNKTPYELFRGFKPALSFMRPFGCHVTILNTLDSLGKFDGKSDEGFFVGYSLSSKAFRVYNTKTRRVEENLHIGFLENKPMIEGNSPKWMFDINSLTQSMNYILVTAGTVSNDSAGTSKENSQDCIVMPIWKDTSYFDSPNKDVDNGEPKTVNDAQKQVEDGPNNENAEQERFANDSSTKDVNADGQHINTASSDVNTSSLKLNVVGPSINTASPNEQMNKKALKKNQNEKRAIGTKWVLRNKKDERGIVIRNKARTIEKEVYVTQPPGFKDPDHRNKVYKVVKALYGLHQAPRAWYETLANYLLSNGFKRGKIDQKLFIKKQKRGHFASEILKKFNYSDVKSASTPVDLEKPLVKDGDVDDVDVHLYRSMIGSLMYLTASRPDIMFVVCACARFQVTPKTSHLLAVKRIFRYLKGKPTLGLWYSRDSPFKLVAYTDSDYARATQDRKSTTGGCQFLGNRLISWQCKKQTVIATSTTEVEYVAVASCCGQVGDEAVHKKLGDRIERAAATSSSLEAEQDSGSGPRCQDTILGDVNAQTRFEITSKQSIDPPFSRGYTLGSGEDNMKLVGIDKIFIQLNAAKLNSSFAVKGDSIKLQLSAKSTAWNEFSSSMASLIICLATNQKFNLSKYIFDAMKVFANMKRAGKDFSGRITPLFETMMVQPVEEMGKDSDHPTDSTPIHIIDQPSSSFQPKKNQPSKKAQRQEVEVSQDEAEHEESVPTPSNDPQPSAKDAQAKEIAALQKRIQRLERRKMSRPTGLKRLRKVGMSRRVESSEDQESLGAPEDASKHGRSIEDIDADVDDDVMHVEAKVDGKDEQSKKPDDSTVGEAVTTATKPKFVTTAATTATTTRPKDRGVVVQEPSEFRIPQETQPLSSKDEGKGIMIEPELPLKKKDQIALDEQIARDIQAKLDAELLEEQKLARKQEEEANIALIESWENTQAMMEADRLLAERLQSKEREELTDEEKAKLFMELIEKRRKHFAALKAQEKRNRPPTKAQKRTQMSTYLKHMGGYTYKQLKGKSFDEIQKLFDKEMKRVNTFVAMGSEVQESKEKKEEGREETAKGSRKKMLGRKRAGKEQQKESSKKQKVEEEKESEEVDELWLKNFW
ncbi:putative ribonuclease H-like domain-containing protein [Tanacetum coccineum]